MDILFRILMFGTILLIGVMLIRVFRGPSVYDRLNGIFVIGIDVILVIMFVGYIDKRADMYIDIAISYGILGFITTIVIARFLGGQKKHDD